MNMTACSLVTSTLTHRRRPLVAALGALILLCALSAPAADLTWTGGGPNSYWSTPGNWDRGTPSDGDTLEFPHESPRLINTNNIIGLTLNQIRFTRGGQGHTLYGNAIRLTNGIYAGNTLGGWWGQSIIDLTVRLGANQTFLSDPTGMLTFRDNIDLSGFDLTLHVNGNMEISGLISGSGNLTKTGSGELFLGGSTPNTYDGTTRLLGGLTHLSNSSSNVIPGNCEIGSSNTAAGVRLSADHQIASEANVLVQNGSNLDLNGQTNTIGSLHLDGLATVETATGQLRLGGNVTVSGTDGTSQILGHLYLGNSTRTFDVAAGAMLSIYADVAGGSIPMPGGGVRLAGLTKTGSGFLVLAAANSYRGHTTVNDGFLDVQHSGALGATTSGTTVNNNGVVSLDSIVVAGESLTLNSTNAVGALRGKGTSRWSDAITLQTNAVFCSYSLLDLDGSITGTGDITLVGNRLQLSGSANNDFTGATFVRCDLLELDHTYIDEAIANFAIPGDLIFADKLYGIDISSKVRLLQPNQLRDVSQVQFLVAGLLDLDDNSTSVGGIDFAAPATIDLGLATLRLRGNVTCGADSQINGSPTVGGIDLGSGTRTIDASTGHLDILPKITGTGGLTKNGAHYLTLHAANTYSGQTTLNAGMIVLGNNLALGSAAGSTRVNGGRLDVHGYQVPAEPLALFDGNNPLECDIAGGSWGGPVTLNANVVLSDVQLTFSNSITGPYSLRFDDSTITYAGAPTNTYTGMTWLTRGRLLLKKSSPAGAAIPGLLIVGDPASAGSPAIVALYSDDQIFGRDVTIHTNGLLDLRGYGDAIDSLGGAGQIDLAGAKLTVGVGNGNSAFDGAITGANGLLVKQGSGLLALNGTNTFTGTNRLVEGILFVQGYQPNSVVVVEDHPTLPLLAGSGTVGHLFMEGGRLDPGDGPGLLTCSNLLMYGAATFTAELNGTTAGTLYDQLRVRGTVALANPVLSVLPGFMPTEGNRFTILNNETANPVTGSFAGLPEGALVSAGLLQFRLSYQGGAGGNDVTLTFTNTMMRASSTSISGAGNGNGVLDTNECIYLNVVVTNGSGAPMTGVVATLLPASPGVAVTYPVSAYPDVAAHGRGTNLEPFQVITWPGLLCGTQVEMDLEVQTATHGNFTLPVSLWSGSTGTPRTNYLITPSLPLGGLDFATTILVTNFPTPVVRVTVSLYLTHTNDSNIDLFLSSPDGTETPLSLGNGGHGNDYGTGCSPWAALTTFDDFARTAIADGVAPFAGPFRPDGDLSVFRGREANGQWHLRIRSRTGSPLTGQQHCWMLRLYPAACADGGGVCESCPDRTIYGFISESSASQDRRLLMNGTPSQCGTKLKPCPGLAGAGPRRYDAYTFINGESNACITVSMTSRAELFSAVYLDAYNPTNLCENYYADRGDGTQDQLFLPYSFEMPANARFVVVVNEVEPGTTAPYTLTVSGGSCRPLLHIDQGNPNAVVLDWTTAAAGYQVEQTRSLGSATPPAWEPAPGTPRVADSRFVLTNSVAGDTNRFYRLTKP